MPRAAIADSDDEGGEIELLVGATEESVVDSKGVTEESATGSRHGLIVRSTSSTAILKRQMPSAEQHLLTNSAPVAMAGGLHSSASPSMQAQKRRHTAAFGSDHATSPDKAAKRTKTMTTYGAKGTAQITTNSAFDDMRNDADGPALKTSQSARFTEHSGYQSSVELPAGSLADDFAHHEPAVMFRDSVSTVADDSSAQQRMIQQALSSKKGLSTSAINALRDEEVKSSSFPWSAKSPGNANGTAVDGAEDASHIEESDTGDYGAVDVNEVTAGTPTNPREETNPTDAEESIVVKSASKPKGSPIVEITRSADSNIRTSRRGSAGTQNSTRSRKQKTEDSNETDPLNSDDKAVGLPKERYQPRPSRRRATGIVEEPIDYSVRPEKAAKTKRTKTANVSNANAEANMSKEDLAKLKADVEKTMKVSNPARDQSRQTDAPLTGGSEDTSSTKTSTSAKAENDQSVKDPPSQRSEVAPNSTNRKSDDHIFLKPSLPTPKANSTAKSRRSRTTIYEDHIEFTGSQTSPSLSQQQAKRKSAAEKNEDAVLKPSQRKRTSVVVDDDDGDEDELAKDPDAGSEAEDEIALPKKRGRGRPSKPKAQSKSAEKVLDNSDDDGESEKERQVEPKKKGRGRPSKAAGAAQSTDAEVTEKAASKDTADLVENAANGLDENGNPKDQSDKVIDHDPKPSSGGKENVTPSPTPEKPAENTAKLPQEDAKPSPTLHSPIKSSSAVPHRVGLSKRHRIPSLLRTMNPRKPKS